ncbi:hypothetical protein J3R82DRAFT_3942 [Butyriboletus roseoflavus]|nr:hypothetical protein J3R82DRAFT_3942 [Butyriboletus roseoflavus]
MFGGLFRLALDALLISAFLAGIKRSTGLTPALSQVPNKDVRQLLRTYLEFGEYAFDFAVVVFGVIPLVMCQNGLLILPIALQLLRTQTVDSFCHWMTGLPHFHDSSTLYCPLVSHLTIRTIIVFLPCTIS